jgi:hypothetical protein
MPVFAPVIMTEVIVFVVIVTLPDAGISVDEVPAGALEAVLAPNRIDLNAQLITYTDHLSGQVSI